MTFGRDQIAVSPQERLLSHRTRSGPYDRTVRLSAVLL